MSLTTEIREDVKRRKPSLSSQSVITYASILKNLYERAFPDTDYNEKLFDDTDTIIEYLHDLESNKRKTILAALTTLTDKKAYRDLMLKDIESYNEKEHRQEQNEKQSESWVSSDVINQTFTKLQNTANTLYKRENLRMTDLQEIQDYIILCLLGGVFIPPRRSKDYVDFKIADIDKSEDNYMVSNTFVFNSYKTAKTYGAQKVEIPLELKKIITKWSKVNPTNYLLFDSKSNQLSNVKLTQRLNKIFAKKVSVNQLRHTYLSDKYQSTIETNKALADDMAKMGSSSHQEKTYIKRVVDI